METSFFHFVLALFILTNISLTSSKSLSNLTTDAQALIAFKNSITNSILLKNWSIHTPTCEWIGVYCGTKHHRVTELNISGLALRGTISPHLGNLTFLRFLDISSNSFVSVLPPELANLCRLEYINVGSNNFGGEIPSWFGALSRLRTAYLYSNRFSGRIPSSIFNISLQTLSLFNNSISGSVPEALFNVSSLMVIDLGINMLSGKLPNNMCINTPKLTGFSVLANQISGEIPVNIIKCRELEILELQVNHFSGEIPSGIGNLSMLNQLNLWQNDLEGFIPKQMWNLTSLERVLLTDNMLKGELKTEEISNLALLRGFLIGNNSFSGEIPPAIFNISALLSLDLSFNEFSGTLPAYMGLSLPNLQLLYLHANGLSGPIPSSINNATQLLRLNLALNFFSGSIPSFPSLRQINVFCFAANNLSNGAKSPTRELEFLHSLTNSQNLQYIEVSENPLNGVLPTSIGNLSQTFQFFSAVGARIGGVIPSEIGNLTNLRDLLLNDNQLSGSIPPAIGNLKKLVRLSLYNNQLRGSIPIDLCEMSSLVDLFLSNNELDGPIPQCMDGIQSLRRIELAFNNLNSSIPPNFWNLVALTYLNLSSNYLSGQISSQIGKLKLIGQLFLSSNLFSGDIPSSIDGCESLEYLNLSSNYFGGSIPGSLGNIRGLSGLDLSYNNLSGMIPESLQDLRLLEYLNLSCNRLEGEIPNAGAVAEFTAQSFLNNSALCGAERFEVPPCLDDDGGSRSKNVGRLMKYILPPLFSALLIVIIVVLLVRRWRRVIVPAAVDSSLGVSWRVTSYIELMQATNSFSEANLLGRGSFGSVFKGALSEGLSIAVKVFNLELEGANKSFETESRILSTIRHRNLVRVIGCCTNMEFKALILEFMPNGSLDKWLYSEGNDSTDILQLLNIAIDVALALEYLHHGNTFPVIHCDIKPSNVLLDEDMTARVADFGISKLFEEGEAMIQTKTLATIGYAAPEYGSEGKVSTSADVYSFGILLLEMLTRKKPTDDMFDGEMSLLEWVSEALEANAMDQVLAPALLSEEDRHFVVKEESLLCVFGLAMKCLAISAEERMNMKEAGSSLKKIKAKVVTIIT